MYFFLNEGRDGYQLISVVTEEEAVIFASSDTMNVFKAEVTTSDMQYVIQRPSYMSTDLLAVSDNLDEAKEECLKDLKERTGAGFLSWSRQEWGTHFGRSRTGYEYLITELHSNTEETND